MGSELFHLVEDLTAQLEQTDILIEDEIEKIFERADIKELTEEELNDLYDLIMAFKTLTDRCKTSIDDIKQVLGKALGHGFHTLGGREIKVNTNYSYSKSKANNDAILKELVARAPAARMIDEETGEIEPEAHALLRLIRTAYTFPPSKTPSYDGMAELRLDYDVYVEKETTPGTKVDL